MSTITFYKFTPRKRKGCQRGKRHSADKRGGSFGQKRCRLLGRILRTSRSDANTPLSAEWLE